MNNKKSLLDLRRTFDIYSCNLNILGIKQKFMNGDSPYKDLVIIIANEHDDCGSCLMKLISSVPMSDEMYCEDQSFIVFGKASKEKVQTLLDSLDKKLAKKLKNFSSIPVVVADYNVIDIFPFEEKKTANRINQI